MSPAAALPPVAWAPGPCHSAHTQPRLRVAQWLDVPHGVNNAEAHSMSAQHVLMLKPVDMERVHTLHALPPGR